MKNTYRQLLGNSHFSDLLEAVKIQVILLFFSFCLLGAWTDNGTFTRNGTIIVPEKYFYVGLLVLGLCAGLLYQQVAHHWQLVKRYKRSHDSYRKYHKRRSGSGPWHEAWCLESYDGGINWYAVEGDYTSGIIIKGRAEEVYPGLLEWLNWLNQHQTLKGVTQ